MTAEQCARCKYAPAPGTYSTCTGDDFPVWSCDMINDPRMPDTMEDDTPCPCYEMDECYKVDDYGYSYCPICGGYLEILDNLDQSIGQDGVNYFEDILQCESCNRKFHREYETHVVIDYVELEEVKEEEK